MSDLKPNKIIVGDETILDLTNDTVNEDTVLQGEIFHDASGQIKVGKATIPTKISDLEDVNIPNPQDGQVLTYNSQSGAWVSQNIETGETHWIGTKEQYEIDNTQGLIEDGTVVIITDDVTNSNSIYTIVTGTSDIQSGSVLPQNTIYLMYEE